jgi:hypothetical protein
MAKVKPIQLDLIVDKVRKQSEAQVVARLAELRAQLRDHDIDSLYLSDGERQELTPQLDPGRL